MAKKRSNKNRNTRPKARPKKRLRFPKTKLLKAKIADPLTFLINEPVRVIENKKSPIPSAPVRKKTKNKYQLLQHGLTNEVKKPNICKRRAERKEIIHALNKSGQAGQKKPNTITSNIKC